MFNRWTAADFDKKYGWQKKSNKAKERELDLLKQLYGSTAHAKDGERQTADGTAGTDMVCHVGKEAGI
jgi:hypothetical protein